MLTRKWKWDYIYLICPTADQKTYDPIREKITRVYKHANEETLANIYKKCERVHADGEKSLLILDDVSAEDTTNRGRKGSLANLSNNARWIGLSMIIITQSMPSITPAFRDNAEAVMVFHTLKRAERQYLLDERNPFQNKETMQRVLQEAFPRGEPHAMLLQIVTDQGVHFFSDFDRLITVA
jgi:hypothetical protein